MNDPTTAKALGVGLVAVWRWRTGRIPVPIEHIKTLCKLLDCTPRDLRPDLARMFEVRAEPLPSSPRGGPPAHDPQVSVPGGSDEQV